MGAAISVYTYIWRQIQKTSEDTEDAAEEDKQLWTRSKALSLSLLPS